MEPKRRAPAAPWAPEGPQGPPEEDFGTIWEAKLGPQKLTFSAQSRQKKSEAIFGKDFGGSGPFWEAFQHRPEKGPSKKRVLDPFLVTFGYFFVAFLDRLRRDSRCQKILQKIHSPQRACWI